MYQTAKEESLKFGTRKPKISAKKRKNPEKKKNTLTIFTFNTCIFLRARNV